MAGVAIDSILDMRELFDGIPLDQMSVSMTMNGAVLPVMALYVVAAEEQGRAATEQLAGTIQNDILKEFMVRNTYIYPPEPSMRIISDIFTYTSQQMPAFNSISISGYHIQEAGATADLELAYTLADGVEYLRAGAGRRPGRRRVRAPAQLLLGHRHELLHGGRQDARGPAAVGQAGRRLRAGTTKSLSLRTHSQTSGWSLTAQDVYNNVVRTCVEAMAATQGHTQSLHTNALDEALALPTDFSARIARNTQLLLQQESGTTRSSTRGAAATTSSGSRTSWRRRRGRTSRRWRRPAGMAKAIEAGIPKLRVEEAAARTQARIDSGRQPVIGVNKYRVDDDETIDVLKVDNRAYASSSWRSCAGCVPSATRRLHAALEALTARRRSRRRAWRQPAGVGDRRGQGACHRRRDLHGAGEGVRPVHRADPYDQRRVLSRGRRDARRRADA
jgi:methylmalonyl-CoA mutase